MVFILTDQGGNKLTRFGASGVKRILLNPVRPCADSTNKDYAMVTCEDSEVFIMRVGVGKKDFSLTLTYWNTADQSAPPIGEEFESQDIDKAIAKFLRQCKLGPAKDPNESSV